MSLATNFIYAAYRRFYKQQLWRKRKITPIGNWVLIGMAVAAALGSNVTQTTVYQLVALAVSLILIAGTISFFFRFKGSVDRILPRVATVGETVSYKLLIRNLTGKRQQGLRLFEDIHDPRPTREELLTTREPNETQRNWWDRKILYYRWTWLLHKHSKASFEPQDLPDLHHDVVETVTASFLPHHRGYLNLRGVILARPDPFGLFMGLTQVCKPQQVLILPKRYDLDAPKLMSSRKYHMGGVALAASVGNADEFMSLRPYRPGDPMRNIHWKSFAKRDELVIKEFEDEFFVRHALILDTFLKEKNEIIFEEAVSIAASYVGSVGTHESLLDLMFVGDQLYSFSSGRGLANDEKMLEILACVNPVTDGSISKMIPLVKNNAPKLSGSICIFLDWDEPRQALTAVYQALSIPLYTVVVCEDKQKMEEKIKKQQLALDHITVVQTGQIEAGFKTT